MPPCLLVLAAHSAKPAKTSNGGATLETVERDYILSFPEQVDWECNSVSVRNVPNLSARKHLESHAIEASG